MNWGISTYYKGEMVYIDLYGYGSTEKKAIICADREEAMQEADRRCRLYMTKNGLGIGRFYFGSKGYHTLECWEKKLAQKKEPLLERLKSIVLPEYIAKLVDTRAVREEFDRINYQTPVEPHYGTSNGKLMGCAWKKPQEEWEVFSALDMDVFLFVVGKLVASECDMAEIKAVLDEMGKLEKPREIGAKASEIYLVLKRHNISLQFSFSRKWEVIWNGLPIMLDSVKESFSNDTTTKNNR